MLMPNNSKGGAARGSTFKDVVKTPGNKRDKQQQGGGNKNPLLPTQQNQKRAPGGQPPNPGDGNKLVSQLSVQPAPSRLRSKRRARDDKPTALMRAWVRVDPQGNSSILHADKLTLTQQLGIQPRDLRLLESQVANQTSVILCRERAIVINMSFVKTIITLDACYIVSPDDERAIQFMAELKNRLQEPLACSKSVAKLTGGQEPEWARQALELPFELRCLEICLDELASDLDERAKQLEATAYPAVDAMAKVSNRPNLDRVRRVKNALIQLYKTTETFHEALEELLDNDKDMWELNLGAKEAARQMAVEEGTGMHGQGRDISDAQHTQLAPVAEDEVLAMAPLPEEPHYNNFTNGETREEDDPGGHVTGVVGEPMDPPPPWLGSPEEHEHHQGEVSQREFMGGAFGSFHPDPHPESQNATTASIGDDSERNAMSDGLAAVSTASAPAALPRVAGGWNTNPLARQAVVAAAEKAAGSSAAGFSEHTDGGSRTRDGSDSGDTELPFPPSVSSTPRAPVDKPCLPAPVAMGASDVLFLSGAASAPASTPAHPQSPPPPGARYRSPAVSQLSPFASASCVGLFDTHPMPQAVVPPASATPTGTPVPGGASGEGPYPGWHQQPQGVSRASLDGMTFSPNRLSLGAASPYDRPLNTMSQHASLVRLSRHSLALLSARHGSSLASSSAMSSVYDMEVAEVERLLEAYFMHINTVHTRLKTLGEYIEDTEEMVYSSLNAKRNRLLAYDLCFIGINTISMTVTAVTGLFTMNLFHPEEDEYMYTSNTFLELAFAGLGAYLLFGGLLAYYMHTGVVRFT